jgi:hypothetical protein
MITLAKTIWVFCNFTLAHRVKKANKVSLKGGVLNKKAKNALFLSKNRAENVDKPAKK